VQCILFSEFFRQKGIWEIKQMEIFSSFCEVFVYILSNLIYPFFAAPLASVINTYILRTKMLIVITYIYALYSKPQRVSPKLQSLSG
jgi:hypothetical protein